MEEEMRSTTGIYARIPESAQRIIDDVLSNLVATEDRDPAEVRDAQNAIIDVLTIANQESKGEISLSGLCGYFTEHGEALQGTIAGEEMAELAQIFYDLSIYKSRESAKKRQNLPFAPNDTRNTFGKYR